MYSRSVTLLFHKLVRASQVVLALAAAIVLVPPVQAQDVPQVISPLRVEADTNGVNLLTGQMQLQGPVLSVPAAPNLRFDRVSNLAPFVSGSRSGGFEGPASGSFSIHTGQGTSESFRCVEYDVCTSVMGTGSWFHPYSLIFKEEGTGATWTFDQKQHETADGAGGTVLRSYASKVDYPSGESLTYEYTATVEGEITYQRPIKVSSSFGYHITVSYHSDQLYTQGWGAPLQAAIYSNANPTAPLGRLTFSLDGATITDLNGRVYQCNGCPNWYGGESESYNGSLRLPGESSDSLVVTPVPNRPVVSTVTRDGVQWTYSYTNLRWHPQQVAWIYDKVTVTGPNSFNRVYDFATAYGAGSENGRRIITRFTEFLGPTDFLGRETDYTYDGAFRPLSAEFPENNRVDLVYGTAANIISKTATAKPGSGLAAIAETAHFECPVGGSVLCNRPVWTRDPLSRQIDYSYNTRGQLIQRDDPADSSGVRRRTIMEYQLAPNGHSRRSVMRVCGVGTTCGTTQEIRTEYSYWGNSSLPSEVRQIDLATSQTLTTSYTYDAEGKVTMEDGPLAGTSDARYFRYDVHGRKTWEIDALGANGLRVAKRTSYRDSDDKPVAVEIGTLPNETSATLTVTQRSDVTYDARRNAAVEAVSAAGATQTLVHRTFDNRNRLECEARRMYPAAFGSLPASACTLGTEGTQGPDRITRNQYDAAGQLLQVQKAYGTPLQQNYATYLYSLNGKRTRVTDANGNRADLRYDGHDRQVRWVFPSKTTAGQVNEADYEAHTYDAAGNRTSLKKRDGVTITYAYDNLNRVTQKNVPASATGAAGYTVVNDYNLRNAPIYTRFGSSAGQGITNSYDAFGRLAWSSNDVGGTARILSYQHDVGSRRTRLTFPDSHYFAYEHDAAGALTAIRENGGTVVASFSYDSAGRVSGQSAAAASTSYGYDMISRLSALSHDLAGTGADHGLTFAYNPASQIVARTASNDAYAFGGHVNVSRSYTVNGLNQYTAAGPATFTYDANGNLTSDGSVNMVYDAENRLVSASGAKTASLSYDPMGRLVQTSGGAPGVTQFLYDGDELVAEYNGSGTLLRRYAHGLGTDDPILWYEGAALTDRRSLHADHQGSVIGVANSAGASIAINSYDSWGIPNATNQGRFQYTGQAWLPELGMYHYKARIYSPTLGRFLQTDPVGYEDQVNLYAYVGNDPVNFLDPTGMAGIGMDCGGKDGTGYVSSSCSGASAMAAGETAATNMSNAEKFSAVGAGLGSAVGTTAGVAIGGTSGALAGATCGPGAVICSPTAGALGAIEGGIVGGTTGAMVGGGVGWAIGKGIDKAVELHGNSSRSQQPTEVYNLINRSTGAIDKIGITNNSSRRYSQAWLEANNVRYSVVERYSTRYPAIVHENISLTWYKATHGSYPRLNNLAR